LRFVVPELLLSSLAPLVYEKVKSDIKELSFDIRVASNERSIELIKKFEADFAFIFSPTKLKNSDFYKLIEEVEFQNFVSSNHPSHGRRKIEIKELLSHHFISAEPSILGLTKEVGDGWRDDKFPRENVQIINSLACL